MSDTDRQFEIWREEHSTGSAIPSETSLAALEASTGVVKFFDWLAARGIQDGRVLDIGCGKGRNSIHAASKGFYVTAMDYVASAIDFVTAQAAEKNLSDTVTAVEHRMDTAWPFKDASFNIIIDSFATIDIDSADGRALAITEMHRVLQPKGFALVMVVSSDDELEAEMIATHPGPEKNSCYWPNGKFQKDYDEDELRQLYADFAIVELQKISKPAQKLGRNYTATNFWMIVQKRG